MKIKLRFYLAYVLAITALVAIAGLVMRNVAFESGMSSDLPSFDYELLISGSENHYRSPREVCFPGTASTRQARGDAYYDPTSPDLPITQGGKRPGNHFELVCLDRTEGRSLLIAWLVLVFLPLGIAIGARVYRNPEAISD